MSGYGCDRSTLGAVLHLFDRRLVLGGLAFDAGWGLAGYCPGPAVASLFTGMVEPVIFVAAMLAGMAVYELRSRVTAPASSP